MSFTWNEEQVSAIQNILEFVKAPYDFTNPEPAMTIIGYAGTGKTTLVQEAIRRAQEANPALQVCTTAPTNKATQVLRDFGSDAGIIVDNCTIYSLLGLVLGSEGEIRNVFQGGEGSFGNYDIVIVDECSMVGNQLFDTIMSRSEQTGTKVIFMGDREQLNPVREKASRTFNKDEVPRQSRLTRIMRQDEDSPIRKVVGGLRQLAADGTLPDIIDTELTSKEDGVHFMEGQDFKEAMLDQFDCEEYKKDSRFCRVLAWTNREVDRLNRLIRNRIYGKGCPTFVVGEDIAVLSPVIIDNVPVIFTDEEVKVVGIGTGHLTDKADYEGVETLDDGTQMFPRYKVYLLNVQLENGTKHTISVLHDDDKVKYTNRLNRLLKKAKDKTGTWKAFYAFQELFTKVRPVHAMTVHKSQGQTFNTVFFLAKDALQNKNNQERARLGYVACSRPTTNLIVNSKRYY